MSTSTQAPPATRRRRRADAHAGPARGSGRSPALDVARGTVVLCSLVMSHVFTGSVPLFSHADWYGLTLLDLVFPSFLTLFGVALAFAGKRWKGGWRRVLRRTAVLAVVGVAFNWVVAEGPPLAELRWTGVLQRLALVGLATTVLARVLRTPRRLAIAAAVVLALHGALLLLSGAGCVGGVPQPGCHPLGGIDAALLGASRVYAQGAAGYDPEGLSSFLGALANGLLGYVAGLLLLTAGRWDRAALRLWGLVAACLVLTPLAAQWVPVGKRIWTPAFALVTAAIAVGLLALLQTLIGRYRTVGDLPAALRPPLWLLEALGKNALLVYFGKYAVVHALNVVRTPDGLSAMQHLRALVEPRLAHGDLLVAAGFAAAWTVLAAVLHARRLYVRV